MRTIRLALLPVYLVLVLFLSLIQPQGVASAPLYDATPLASLSVPANVFLGSDFSLTVTFDNTGDEVGFGPYLDLFLPFSGADGLTPVGMTPGTVDGVSFLGADYLGANVTTQLLYCPAGGSVTHPLTGLVVNCPSQPAGLYAPFTWQMIVITLPFGSFVPTQPPAPVTVQARLSPLADLNADLPVMAFGGFMFGRDALDNPASDPPLRQALPSNTLIDPSLFTVAKTYAGPENETATGPNFTRSYTLSAQIASGQTLQNFVFEDVIPDNMQFVAVVSTSPAATCLQPSITQPGGLLSCAFGSVSGTVSLTFEFFIPLNQLSGGVVIDPVTGDDEESCNQSRASAEWDPIDERDLPETFIVDPPGCEHHLEDKSIAIQKSVSVVGGGEPVPGARLRYTLSIQVSDFFVFDDLVVTDVISDGQRLVASSPPSLQVNGNTFSLGSTPFASSHYSVDCDYSGGVGPECTVDSSSPPNSGTTTLTFDLSAEIDARTGGDGRLVGGCVPTGGTTTGDPDCSVYNDGGTTATLVFETVIQEEFSDDYPSGDESVDQGDLLTNTVDVEGNLLSTLDALSPTGETEADISAASVVIRQGQVSKAIHAINGNTAYATPVRVSPDDVVTYRVRYTLVTSDFEDLVITDFLPLPIFRAVEVTGLNNPALPTDCGPGGVPPAGRYCLGAGDTYHSLPGAITPTLLSDPGGNWLRWTYGDYDSAQNQPTLIEILFSVTVTDDPFADGLFLTNQAQGAEGSTNTDGTDSTSIIQIQIQEPVLGIEKGVVWSNSANAVFNPAAVGPVTFDGAAATCTARLGGLVTSSGLASSPVNSNLNGVDAGDLALMAVVVENTGRHSAFDVRIEDNPPAGLVVVPGSVCITDGSGAAIAASGDLFSGGITLIDPGPTDPPAGALDPGITGDGVVIDNGRNLAVITYLVQLASNLEAGATVNNTASITAYAGSEGGQNHLGAPRSDDAEIRLALPILAKSLIGTEINNGVNANTEAVIGELVIYEVTATFPEGVTPGAQIVDTLDTGLAFVDCVSINAAADLSTSLAGGFTAACNDPVNPVVSMGGGTITFSLGDISNANTDNGAAEIVVIRYTAVVLNIASNQSGSQVNNSARLSWSGGDTTISAANVVVIEPLLDATKLVSPLSTDAGNTVTYTLTLRHAGGSEADAFEITLSDPLPLCSVGGSSAILDPVINSVTDSTAIIDSSYFELVGSNAAGWTLQTRTPPAPFDFQYSATRTITIGLSGSLAYCVTPGQTLVNTVATRWSSLDGTVADRSPYNGDSDERTGTGGVNDYIDTGSATLTVSSAAPSKYLVATSEAHTGVVAGNSRLAVGEIVRYRVVAQIPEGTIPNFQINDLLPVGLIFLNDNTTRYGFVSDGAGITSSTVGIVPALTNSDCLLSGTSADGSTPAIPATCTLGDNHIGSTADTGVNTDSYASGSDPFFKFGNLANNDNDDDAEFVVVEFNAIADNTVAGSNDAADNRDNQARVLVNGAQSGANSNTVRIVIAEPLLTLSKTGTIDASRDAGDSVSYTLSVIAASGDNRSTAFDLSVRDALDAFLTPGSVTITTNQPATCSGNGGGTTLFDAPYSWSGNTLSVNPTCLDPGRTITITIAATVNANVPAGYVIPNTGSVRWTSLPGAGSTGNTTGSDTPGGSGAGNGERDGSQYNIDTGATTGINDHGSRGTLNLTLNTPQISKQAPPASGYPIGATVTYPIRITLPEGISRTVRVVDAVPNGMIYLGYSLDTTGYTGSVNLPTVTPATPANGDDITFNFGDITTTNDNSAGNNAFTLNVTLRVLDVSGNQIGTTLTNSASLIYTPGTGSTDTSLSGGSQIITVVEPRIATTKDVTPTSGVQSGDVVNYLVRFTNTGTATAYDVTAQDTLAQGVSYNNDAACVFSADGVVAPVPIPVAVTSGAGTLLFDGSPAESWDIPVNGYIQCSYTATAQASLYLDGSHTNMVDADWTSLDGVNADERVYQDLVVRTVDGTQDTDTAVFTSPAPLFAKSDNGTSEVVIGQVIDYTLTLQSANGTLRSLQVSDTLPAGLVYVDASQSVGSGISPLPVFTVSSPNDGSQPVMLSWQFGDAVISSSPITITFQARVANVAANQDGQTRNNQASLNYTNATGEPRQLTAADDVIIREPVLEIEKVVDDSSPPPNGTVTYTLTIRHSSASTADAFDVSLADLIPAGLVYVNGSFTHSSGLVPTNLSAVAPSLSAEWASFPLGSTSVLTFQVSIPFPSSGTVYTNTAVVDWTSLSGGDANERTGSGGINDYSASDNASLTSTAPDLSILKTDSGVSSQPGGVVVYTLSYQNNGNGSASNVLVSEEVPDHTRFVAGSSSAGWSCADGAPAGTSCSYTVGSLAGGAGGTLQFAVQVDDPLPVGVEEINNTVRIADDGSRGPDPTPDNNTATDTTPLTAAPDLAISKDDGVSQAQPGDLLVYGLSYSNNGNQGASGVVISETVPDHTRFVAGSSSAGWSCADGAPAGTSCSYTVGSLAGGAGGTLQFAVQVDDPLPVGVEEINNTVRIADDSSNGDDPTPDNNTDTDTDTLDAAPDLAISKDDGVSQAQPGDLLVYGLSYSNNGNQGASGVVISETVPDHTRFVAGSSSAGWSCADSAPAGTSCSYTVGSLAGGAGGTLQFAVQVDDPLPVGVEEINNTVRIADDSSNGDDPTPDNNTDTDTDTLDAAPDLAISKDDGVSQVAPGASLTYVLLIENRGNQTASGVLVTDTIPPGSAFVSASDGGVYDPASRQVSWPLFDLAAGAPAVRFTLTVAVDNPIDSEVTSILNTVVVRDDGSNGDDPTPENNSASDEDLLGSAGKTIIASNQAHTALPAVAVGEILTYEVRLKVEGLLEMNNVMFDDLLDRGLAFVACDEVSLSGVGLTSSRGDIGALCPTAVISTEPGGSSDPQDRGRRMRIDFGTLTNTNEVPVELIVRYRVVVLNSGGNVRDTLLTNRADWNWTGGSLPVQAAAVRVVEPDLLLDKGVDPDVGLPDSVVTYSLKISLDPESNSDAFNVVLSDTLPRGLTYIPGSLRFVSGVQPTLLDDRTAPLLRVGWDVYPLNGGETLIAFQAELRDTSPGEQIENQAVLAWTSLPGNFLQPQSPYNPLSNERYYDPGSNVNNYGTSSRALITIPALPATGFAPRQVTVLPQQPLESRYTQTNNLVLEIPSLGVRVPIVGVPMRAGQWDLTWLANQAGYLEGTAYPTLEGNTGLTAHVFDANGQPGPFVALHTLNWGDEILLRAGSATYQYQVRDVRRVQPNDLSPLKHEERDWITLITCQGFEEQRNAYRWRVAVRAVLIRINP